MSWTFDTLDAATQGLLSDNTITISVQGLLTFVEIEEVVEAAVGGGYSPAVVPSKEKKKKYKIRVTVFINGEKYVEEKEVIKIKKPTISDVDITLNTESQNPITIKIKK